MGVSIPWNFGFERCPLPQLKSTLLITLVATVINNIMIFAKL